MSYETHVPSRLWDLPFDALTMEETLQWIEDAIAVRVPRQHTVINAAKVVNAGKVQHAPLWMQKASLEWFYRLMREPRRLFARYAVTNAAFIYRVARESLNRKAR